MCKPSHISSPVSRCVSASPCIYPWSKWKKIHFFSFQYYFTVRLIYWHLFPCQFHSGCYSVIFIIVICLPPFFLLTLYFPLSAAACPGSCSCAFLSTNPLRVFALAMWCLALLPSCRLVGWPDSYARSQALLPIEPVASCQANVCPLYGLTNFEMHLSCLTLISASLYMKLSPCCW